MHVHEYDMTVVIFQQRHSHTQTTSSELQVKKGWTCSLVLRWLLCLVLNYCSTLLFLALLHLNGFISASFGEKKMNM